MRYLLTLGILLVVNWLFWSTYFDHPFLLAMGLLSCLASLGISRRMRIVDEEGAPVQLGLRPFVWYAPWLVKQIIISNIKAARIILSPTMPLERSMIEMKTLQKSELGRVILANSITITPGTVSVSVERDRILVHALSATDATDGLSEEMDRRIADLERRS